MGQPVKELTSTQKTINIIIVAVLLVYSIVSIYLATNAFKKLDSNVDALKDIVANWQTKSISDVQVSSACASGYETAFNDRYWPGTSAGCYCGGVTQSVLDDKNITCGPFCTGSCSTTAISVGCSNVAGNSQKLLNFVSSISGVNQQICIKRTTESWDQVAPISAGTCPVGYLKCGTSADNVFCTKESQCPVTGITRETYNAINCNLNANCKRLSDTEQIILRRGDDTLPLAELTLNEFQMCGTKTKDNITPARKTFPLLAKKPTTCYSEGVAKWPIEIAPMTEAQLFQYNSLTATIASFNIYTGNGMTGYYETSKSGNDYTWRLFGRAFIPWKVECRDRMQTLINKKEFVINSRTAQKALLAIACISGFFLGIVLSIMEIQNLRGVDLSCFDGKGEEERAKLKRFKKFVNYGFKFVQIPFQIWAILLATGSKNLFADVATNNCSSGVYDATIDFLAENLKATHSSNLTSLGILLATLLLDLILAAWDSRKKKTDAVTPSPQPPQEINQSSTRPLQFDQSSPSSPERPQHQAQPQPQQNITIELRTAPQQYPQQPAPMQFNQQPQPMQFGAPQQQQPMQFNQQPQPMQFGAPQQYPQQQPMQFAPQQYPQQQYPPRY